MVPVLGGRIIRSAVRTLRLGGASLTQLFAELLSHAGVDAEWQPSMGGEQIAPITVARNLKEKACEVFPTPLRELFGRSPFALDHVLQRSDAPLKEVRLVKGRLKEGKPSQGGETLDGAGLRVR